MSSIRLRVRGPNGGATLNLAVEATLGDLKSAIAGELQPAIPATRQRLRVGFPPQIIDPPKDGVTLTSLGITNGESLVVEDAGPPENDTGSGGDRPATGAPTTAPTAVVSPPQLLFKVGQRVIYRGGDGIPLRVAIAQYSANVPAGAQRPVQPNC